MKFGTSLAAATIATVASATTAPKPNVANFAYAHQWDVVNVEGFNLLFSSAYDIGVMTDVLKAAQTFPNEGNV